MFRALFFFDRRMASFVRGLIRGYQLFLSPALALLCGPGSGCRHEPSCSAYALQCFQDHPVPRATGLTLRRLARCQPWGTAGFDPVPPPTVRSSAR